MTPKPARHTPETFWRRFEPSPTGCLEWTGARSGRNQYGRVTYHQKNYAAHRLAWILTNGQIPSGAVVCHRCDNPICGNVEHLFIGTQADNLRDMRRKGRASDGTNVERGVKRYNAKLTDDLVREARRLSAEGVTFGVLAELFDVDPATVRLAVRRKTWKHVP